MYNVFSEIAGKDCVFLNEPMKKHTTFRIGGAADYYIKCKSKDEMQEGSIIPSFGLSFFAFYPVICSLIMYIRQNIHKTQMDIHVYMCKLPKLLICY